MIFHDDTIRSAERGGWIEVICGSMFSGKTEELIRRIRRAEFAKLSVSIFKPKMEVRYSEKDVVSHDAASIHSVAVDTAENILSYAEEAEVVGIDEAQFFEPNLVDVCNTLADKGKRVIVAGLDMDYRGKPFGPIPDLMATAEFITKVHAVCVRCGNLANYSHRISQSNDLVVLGEGGIYEPLCRKCYLKV